MPRRFVCLLSAVLLAALASGCKKQAATTAAGPPPVQVVVVEAKAQPVAETLSLPATLAPNETVEIKPETDGIVRNQLRRGRQVNAGHVLCS
jgi:multidrug efflux pump subunit AcrA (membrane-fusion protein)